jgi:hypothetical protein
VQFFSDESEDKKKITFRTDLTLIFGYFPPYQKGISNNNYSNSTFDVLDYTGKNDIHHKTGNEGRIIGSAPGDFKAALCTTESINFPFKLGENFLLSDSSLGLNFMLNITPVSLNGGSEVLFTPFPFLVFGTGYSFGTGWNIPGLANGLARNNYNGGITGKSKNILAEDNFYGAVFNGWFSVKLQFDLSFLMTNNAKRWTHIVFQVTPKFAFTGLISSDFYNGAYEWEADGGETLNGWSFYGEYIIGYKIPVIEDNRKTKADKKQFMGFVNHNDFAISLLFAVNSYFSLSHYNDSKMSAGGWGSDFVNVEFGPNILFNLPSNFYLLLSTNFSNGKKFTLDSVGEAYYQDRKYEDWNIKFNRIAVVFGYYF